MPKNSPPLTALGIKNLKPELKAKTYFDGGKKGLHLLVQPNGTKIFRLKTKIDKKDKRITLGIFPDMGLAEAREIAEEKNKLIKSGIDPTKPIVPNSFKKIAELFVEWKEKTIKRDPATIKGYKALLENDLYPKFQDTDIEKINANEVIAELEKIEKRSNSQAFKNRELICMIVKYAVQKEYRTKHTELNLSGIFLRSPPKT